MADTILAIDVGQTGARAYLETGGAVEHLKFSFAATAVVDAEAVHRFVTGLRPFLGRFSGVKRSVIGTTGYPDIPEIAKRLADELCSELDTGSLTVTSDRVTGFIGSIGSGNGVALTWGTGTVALGASDGTWVRVDGRGFALGDEGGGFWIGQRGLIEALNWFDGRGGSELLAAEAKLRIGEPSVIFHNAYALGETSSFIASFAPAVVSAARAGDQVSAAILDLAAAHAASTATSALTQLRIGEDSRRIALTGGLSEVPELRQRIDREISQRVPGCMIESYPGAPLDGAARLARSPGLGSRFAELMVSIEEPACST